MPKDLLTAGFRTAHDDFWTISGVLDTNTKWSHTPFMVLTELPANTYAKSNVKVMEDHLAWKRQMSDPDNKFYNEKFAEQAIREIPGIEKQLKELKRQAKKTEVVPAVIIHDRLRDLLAQDYPVDTTVFKQWQGQWRSDFFETTVGEIRKKVGA